MLTATVAIPRKIEVVASQPIHLLNNPMISAFATVLKCKLKPRFVVHDRSLPSTAIFLLCQHTPYLTVNVAARHCRIVMATATEQAMNSAQRHMRRIAAIALCFIFSVILQ